MWVYVCVCSFDIWALTSLNINLKRKHCIHNTVTIYSNFSHKIRKYASWQKVTNRSVYKNSEFLNKRYYEITIYTTIRICEIGIVLGGQTWNSGAEDSASYTNTGRMWEQNLLVSASRELWMSSISLYKLQNW